nr:helix-turn-helix transcriptional regulator [Streptomyces typhae]
MRARRLARGWSCDDVAERLSAAADQVGISPPRTDANTVGQWERGLHEPKRATLELLCSLYECSARDLGFGTQPLTASAALGSWDQPQTADARMLPEPVGDPLAEHVEAARRSVDRTLALSTVSAAQMDLLDMRILEVRRQYLYEPPTQMLRSLLGELEEVKCLAADRQPASVQVRLSEMTAVLATLIADSLMKLGKLASSRKWYDTAQSAADDSGRVELRARVRAQRAMLPYYYGPLEGAVVLGREARLLTRGRPTSTAAFAAAAEARALARQGSFSAAETVITTAQRLYEQCEHGSPDDAFAFPERRLLLYLSGAYTAMGRSSQARKVQAQALDLYPERTGIDPALLHLEAAICLAHDHSAAEACQLAGRTVLQVPAEHRTHILQERARDVLGVLPPRIRGARAARELTDILALSQAGGDSLEPRQRA